MKNAVIYARFSSANQREESIEGQERDCRSYAKRQGYKVIRMYADRAMTGTNDKRPEFQRMILDSSRGEFDVVLCWKHDRFARNRYDAAVYKSKLRHNNVSIEYVMESNTEGAEGIIVDSLMEGLAEYYSANLSENVKRGMRESALKRQHLGVATYGYNLGKDGKYTINPVEASVVARIFDEYTHGTPTSAIIRRLNEEGIRTRNGGAWGMNSARSVLKNEKYIGVYKFGDIREEGVVPPIVEKEVFDKAQKILEAHKKAPRHKDEEGAYLLSGKLYCGECESPMTAGAGTSRTGKVYRYYACDGRRKKHNGCPKKNVPKELIEQVVKDEVHHIIYDDDEVNEFADQFMIWQAKEEEERYDPYTPRLKEVEKQLGNGMRALLSGFQSSTLEQIVKELEAERDALKKTIEDERKKAPEITREQVVAYLLSFRGGDMDDESWTASVFRVFVDRVYVWDDGRILIKLNHHGKNKVESKSSSLAQALQPTNANSNPTNLWTRLAKKKDR